MYNLYSTKVDRLKVNKTIKILNILGSSAWQGYIKMLDLGFFPPLLCHTCLLKINMLKQLYNIQTNTFEYYTVDKLWAWWK